MNINKIASSDAAKWARAEMFFGDGAGTRRKLLWAEIQHKIDSIPDYHGAFENAYVTQNFADHAIKAAKERKRIDRTNVIGKNAKALLRGDRRGLSTGVLIIVTIGYVAYQTGYDKKIEEHVKMGVKKAKRWIKVKRDEQKLRSQF